MSHIYILTICKINLVYVKDRKHLITSYLFQFYWLKYKLYICLKHSIFYFLNLIKDAKMFPQQKKKSKVNLIIPLDFNTCQSVNSGNLLRLLNNSDSPRACFSYTKSWYNSYLQFIKQRKLLLQWSLVNIFSKECGKFYFWIIYFYNISQDNINC